MIDQIEARLHLARMAFPQALTNVGIDSDAALKYIDVARRAADDGLVSYAVIVVSEAYSAALAGHTRRRRRTGIPGCYRVRFAAVASVSVSSGGCACITSGNLTSQRLSAACAHASWHASAFKRHIGVDQPQPQVRRRYVFARIDARRQELRDESFARPIAHREVCAMVAIPPKLLPARRNRRGITSGLLTSQPCSAAWAQASWHAAAFNNRREPDQPHEHTA